MQNLDLTVYFSLYLATLPMHIDVFKASDADRKRLSFFMSGRNFEANTWVGLISTVFEIKPIPPVSCFVACN